MSDVTKKVNDGVVKMDWDADKALYRKGVRSKNDTFIFASKEYETSKGVITVFFNCYTAFIWADDAGEETEDRYNAKELKSWVKSNLDEAFPLNYSNYIPIVEYGASKVNQDMVDKYDLGAYVDDILARLVDLKPYAEEKTFAL